MECPVCFESLTDDTSIILKTKCNHKFCDLCLLQCFVLSQNSSFNCPVCRENITIFDIFYEEDGMTALGKPLIDISTNLINSLIFSQGLPEVSAVGIASYHFHFIYPSREGQEQQQQEGDQKASYISYKNAPQSWKLDNGESIPCKKYFTNCSYNVIEREFYGTIEWNETPLDGSNKWMYRMQFSDNFMSIESGECKSYDSSGNLLRKQEFGKDLRYHLDVYGIVNKIICELKESKNLCPVCFEALLNKEEERAVVLKTAECEHRFCLCCTLQWLRNETSLDNYSFNQDQNYKNAILYCPLCRNNINIFSILIESGPNTTEIDIIEKPLIQTPKVIDDLIFSQGIPGPNAVGVASYHFHLYSEEGQQNNEKQQIEEDQNKTSYISYKNAPHNWKLDNGAPFPSKKYFSNCSYNEIEREFHGTVQWDDTPISGNTKWIYRMNFSDNFMLIENGECNMYDVDGNLEKIHKFNEDLRYHLDVYALLKKRYSLK